MAIWGDITAIVLLRRNYCREHFAAKSLCHMRFAGDITAMVLRNYCHERFAEKSLCRERVSAKPLCHVRFTETSLPCAFCGEITLQCCFAMKSLQ